ncbi:hypothetical protein [Streptomyces sp. NPDC058964]|uniref:hypothetical protein n=1 Tax=Streptomyces sp. NPDC058964 TaxID=3346681 RepID=UPI00367E3349
MHVDDIDRALPAVRELTGQGARTRYSHGEVEAAGILLVAGSEAALAPFHDVRSTLLVDDPDGLHGLLDRHGGEILSGPNRVPQSATVVRHSGGAVVVYAEHLARPAS